MEIETVGAATTAVGNGASALQAVSKTKMTGKDKRRTNKLHRLFLCITEILPSLFGQSQTSFATLVANVTIRNDGIPETEISARPGIVINIL